MLACALERMGWFAMHAARFPAGLDCLVLGWGVSEVEQDNPRTVPPRLQDGRGHPSSLHHAGRPLSGNAIFYTRGEHTLVFGSSAPEYLFSPFYMLVLFSSDCHSPGFTLAYDRPSTDQASLAILSLYSRSLAVASSMAWHNTGIKFAGWAAQ